MVKRRGGPLKRDCCNLAGYTSDWEAPTGPPFEELNFLAGCIVAAGWPREIGQPTKGNILPK